jgi:hypothetical protein
MQMWSAARTSLVSRLIGECRARPDLMEHVREGWPELHEVLVELDEHDQAMPWTEGPSY